MRRGNILEGIRAGFQAYMQGRQFGAQMDTNKLQQEQMAMTNRMREQQYGDYMSPEDQAKFDLENKLGAQEALYTQQQPWKEKDIADTTAREKSTYEWKRQYDIENPLPGRQGGNIYGAVDKVTGITNDIMEANFGLLPNTGVASIPIYNKVMAKVANQDPIGANAAARVYRVLHPMDKKTGEFAPHWSDVMEQDEGGKVKHPYYSGYQGGGQDPSAHNPVEYLEMMAKNGYTDDQLRLQADRMNMFINVPAGPPALGRDESIIRSLATKYNITEREARELYLQSQLE